MIPPTVNILGLTYAVERVPYISKEEYTLGSVNYPRQVIEIDADLTPQKAQLILFHEIFHCILTQLCFDDENCNEKLIQGLATALFNLTKTNPEIFT